MEVKGGLYASRPFAIRGFGGARRLIEFRLKGLLQEAAGELLVIHFVTADRGMIRGTMNAYWDPDRECLANASFLGSVDGDVIAGSFVSTCDDGVRVLRGRWRVERRRAAEIAPRDPIASRADGRMPAAHTDSRMPILRQAFGYCHRFHRHP